MTRDKIIYSESIETFQFNGLKLWKRAEISAALSEDDNPLECLSELKKDVQSFLQSPPEVPIGEALYGLLPIQQVDNPVETRIGLFIDDIQSCKDLITLETYKLLVKGKPDLQEAYDKRLKELQ